MTTPAPLPTVAAAAASRAPELDPAALPPAGPGHDAGAEAAARPALPSMQRFVVTAAAIALGILALHHGQAVLMPLAFAALLAFVLSPLVTALRRLRVPQSLAVGIVIACTLAAVAGVGGLLAQQVKVLGSELPAHQATIQKKLRELLPGSGSDGVVAGTSRVLGVVEGELKAAREKLPGVKPESKPAQRAVAVEPAPEPPLKAVAGLLKQVMVPLATAGLVVVLLAFMLSQRRELRDRLVRLTGGDLHRMADVLNDAARRVSRYLIVQLLVNVGHGLPLALGLWWIGVPGAWLWGFLAAVLRFVPYLGPATSAVFPLLVAFAVDPGWEMVAWTAALLLTLELISNNVVEPLAYSGTTGISEVAVVASAAFWALVWGPVGLVLATPLTVCLVVLGRHLRPLRFLDLLLGNAPVFDKPTQLYQRLISGDRDEAIELGRREVARTSLRDFYSAVAVPMLALAARPGTGQATAAHRHRLISGVGALLERLAPNPTADPARRPTTLCVGARGELDTLSAEMLAQTLAEAGLPAAAVPAAAANAERIGSLPLDGVHTICLCTFSATLRADARYACRRLRRRAPALRIVLAAWTAPGEMLAPGALAALGADALVVTLGEAAALLQADSVVTPGVAAASNASESAGIVAAYAGAADEAALQAARETLTRGAQRVADVFGVPLVTAVLRTGDDEALWAHAGTATWTQSEAPQALPQDSPLGAVLSGGQALVLSDVSRAPQFAGEQELQFDGLRFFAGAPLALPDGAVIGALSIHDAGARSMADGELRLLARTASELAASVAARQGITVRASLTHPAGRGDAPPPQTAAATSTAAPA